MKALMTTVMALAVIATFMVFMSGPTNRDEAAHRDYDVYSPMPAVILWLLYGALFLINKFFGGAISAVGRFFGFIFSPIGKLIGWIFWPFRKLFGFIFPPIGRLIGGGCSFLFHWFFSGSIGTIFGKFLLVAVIFGVISGIVQGMSER